MTILIKNGQRYFLRQLEKDLGGKSIPENPSPEYLAQHGAHKVERAAPPAYDPMTQRVVESFVDVDGTWQHVWTVENKTEAEILEGLPWQNATEARKAVVEWIDGLTSQIEQLYPSSVQKRWHEEEAAARAVKAGTATQAQIDMMTNEGASKGRTAEQHADAVIANADKFRAIANEVNKLFLATTAQLDAAASPLEYPAIFEWAQGQAAPLAAAYGLEVSA
jgi:hypothetical protein